jgi:hypothetical protein
VIDRKQFVQEMQLRQHIREAIKVVKAHRRGTIQEEKQLRSVIQQLILEADPAVATAAPHANTGINALEDLFKNTNLLTVLRTGYKSLTSKKEQRESYKNHILNAVDSSLEVEDSRFLPREVGDTLQEASLTSLRQDLTNPISRAREEEEVSVCLLRYAEAYAEEAGVPVEQLLSYAAQQDLTGNFNPDQLGGAGHAGGLGGVSKEECDDLIRKYPEQAPAAIQNLLREEIDINVGAPEENPAFIDVEKKEPTPEEEVDEFSIAGQDKTGRNRAYTDYKDVEKNIITAFDDLDDPSDREMFKDYMMTNLKLYFERFEDELKTDLPPPEIQTPPEAEVVPGPGGPPEELPPPPPLGLQEKVNLDMDEIVEWLLSNDMKK